MDCQHKSRVWENGWCNVACSYCTLTQESTCKHNKQTNADRIRAMSDEELADLMAECNAYGERADASQWLPWLKQPAEEEKTVTEGHR